MKNKLFMISGAEGVGKTTALEGLRERFPKMDIHDFDDVGVPENPPLSWRLETTKYWLEKAFLNQEKGVNTCVIGLSFPEEIKEFEEYNNLDEVVFCLLDVSEEERKKRLIERGASRDVIEYTDSLVNLRKQFGDIEGEVIDTTELSQEEVLGELSRFVEDGLK